MEAEESVNRKPRIWCIIGIVGSWLTFWISPILAFSLMIWIAILTFLLLRKSKLKWYFLLSAWFFVPGCNFVVGSLGYLTGYGVIKGTGGPITYLGIDRETRAPSTTSGCISIGYEPFAFPANNFAVTLWTKLFGFQRGSYAGVFPSESEAAKLINSADTMIVSRKGTFFQFSSSTQMIQADSSEFYGFLMDPGPMDSVRGKILNNECFLVQPIDEKDSVAERTIYLVDIGKQKLLTHYFYF